MLTAGRAVLLPIAVYAWQVLGAGQPLFASWSVLLVDLLVDTPAFLCSYTSYLLTMASTLVMVPSLSRLLVFGELVIYFEVAARHEERKFAGSALAEEYARYRQRTGRFLPKFSATRR